MPHLLHQPTLTNRRRGFTLVEVLVVMPLAILIIGVLVGYIVSVTGEALRARAKNQAIFTVQDALDTVEFNVVNATDIPTSVTDTTGTFHSTTNNDSLTTDKLILQSMATNINPLSPDRSLVYKKPTGGDCTSNEASSYDPIAYYNIIFIENDTLKMRTVNEVYTGERCAIGSNAAVNIYQKNTCNTCTYKDDILANNVTAFNVRRINKDGAMMASSNTGPARGAWVDIEYAQMVAGEQLTHSDQVTVNSINIQQGE